MALMVISTTAKVPALTGMARSSVGAMPFQKPRAEAVAHGAVLLVGAKAVGLHLALDDVEGVAGEPESLAGETTIEGDLVAGDLLAVDVVASGVGVHEVLEGGEPGTVGKGLTPDGDGLATVETAQGAVVGRNLADAVERAVVEAAGAVGLALQADTDMLDGAREDRVGDTGEGASAEVLAVGEFGAGVAGLEPAAGGVEGAKLDGDASTNADKGGESALVEGEGALVLVDGGGGVEGGGVLVGGLQTDLDDIKRLACGGISGWLFTKEDN
jgi:hypothetical protein